MRSTPGPAVIFGLTGFETTIDGVCVSADRTARLELPETFTPDHMERIRNDLAILADTAAQKPNEMMAFQNAVLTRDPAAGRLADELGLTEEKMAANGGGLVWVVIAIAVAAALLLESDSPTPPGPAPDAGAPDAGPG
jgi:hypothetical protein